MAIPSLAGLDANLLVALDVLLREQHVGRAARVLGLSESAMSHALARARALFDDPLLVRVGRQMQMTTRATHLAPALRDGLSLVASAVRTQPSLDLASERRTVRVAATDYAHSVLGRPLWQAVSKAAPHVNIAFTNVTDESYSGLARGEHELVISKPKKLPSTRRELLLTERYVTMVREGHPALSRRLTVARFAALEHIIVAPVTYSRGMVDGALKKRGLSRRIAYVSPTFLGAARLVSVSDLVLTGSEQNAREVADWLRLRTFPPPTKLRPFTQFMLWSERHEHDPFLSWFRDRVRDTARLISS